MRRAFYAGASAFMAISLNIGEDSISEDAGVAIMQGLQDELLAFTKRVQEGKA